MPYRVTYEVRTSCCHQTRTRNFDHIEDAVAYAKRRLGGGLQLPEIHYVERLWPGKFEEAPLIGGSGKYPGYEMPPKMKWEWQMDQLLVSP
jgi:hypothetical protein